MRAAGRVASDLLPAATSTGGGPAGGRVLTGTRNTVAWASLGHAVAAYDIALTYAQQRTQFGSRSPPSR